MTLSSLNRSALAYRPCVGIALFNSMNQVFVGERIDTQGAWQMPQGGIDEGEDIETAALRELYEEVGTREARIIKIAPQTLRYDLPDHLVRSLWDGRYRGQEQTWVAMRFTGNDSDINLSVHDPAEFSAWQWVNLTEILDLIVPFKRDLYKQVIDIMGNIKDL